MDIKHIQKVVLCIVLAVGLSGGKAQAEDNKSQTLQPIMIERVKIVTQSDDFEPIDYPIEKELQEFIFKKSDEYNIDPYIIIAIGENESGWQEVGAVMDTNGLYSTGYMQINSICWDYLMENGLDVHDKYENIESGIFLLSTFLQKYNTSKALACYQCGEGRVLSMGIETTSFSDKITTRAEELKLANFS